MKKIISSALILTSITGCVSLANKPIEQTGLLDLNGKTIIITQRNKADFSAMTAGKAAFALIGALAMISAGNKIVAENHIEDPSFVLGESLAKGLQAKYGVQVKAPAIKTTDGNIEQIANVSNSANYAIDVQTVNWGFGYFPTDWSHYRVIYVAKARLINLVTKQVIAENGCVIRQNSNENAPTHEAMLANEAALLKSMINKAVSECQKKIETETFKL